MTMISLPDLLHHEPRVAVDHEQIRELLELGFLGKETGGSFDQAIAQALDADQGWHQAFFAEDLFIHELVDHCFKLQIEGRPYAVNQRFLYRVLASPPTDQATIDMRQAILRELDDDPGLLARYTALYKDLHHLLGMFKVPGHAARLDINSFRLDLLRQAKAIIDGMVRDFSDAGSAVRRLHDAGADIQASREYGILASLLDYDDHLSELGVDIRIGANGQITFLDVREVRENRANPFYRSAAKRLWDKLRFLYYGYRWSARDVVSRLVHSVFTKISPFFSPLIQILGHLEVYLTARQFRQQARDAGHRMVLAAFDGTGGLRLDGLFNPLLMDAPAVATDIATGDASATVLITGPNSGGKTRLLQAIGLAQVLGQSGLYVPARVARLPRLEGLYVSLIEREAADQREGRLGRELIRIREMFEAMRGPSMAIFDELCSGTNPSEGIEVFQMVLRLLERQGPLSFISTHFLDFARELYEAPPVGRLEFLQVAVAGDQRSTYQFVEGVASTSLAAAMAKRLGVTFDELTRLMDERERAAQTTERAPDPRGDGVLSRVS